MASARFLTQTFDCSKKLLFSHGSQLRNCLRSNHKQALVTYHQPHRLSHHPPFPYPKIPSEKQAKNLVLHLDDQGRSLLYKELQKHETEKQRLSGGSEAGPQVPVSELWKVFFFNGLPFIGFGILDNVIMILAGEYIDVTLGAALGISTMAAAALGNLISDVAGIGSAGYVELWVSKIGVHPPDITPAQALAWQSRWSCALGRALGISVGCLIGMFPLLFFTRDAEEKKKECADRASNTTEKNAERTLSKPTDNAKS